MMNEPELVSAAVFLVFIWLAMIKVLQCHNHFYFQAELSMRIIYTYLKLAFLIELLKIFMNINE